MRAANSLRRQIERGEAVLGARSATHSPTIVEVYGSLGLDFVWLDFEHSGPSPYDSTVFEELTRAAEAGGIELLVRLPTPDPSLVRKVLDAGVRSILLPRIQTAAELQPAVEAGYFGYDGDAGSRGVGVGRTTEWAGYDDGGFAREDEEVLVGAMIESQEALDNLAEILSVPHLGFVFVGPADLEISMSDGDLRTDRSEAIDAAIEETREEALRAEVPIGCIQHDATAARRAIDDGYQLVRIGGEIAAVREVLGDRLDDLAGD